MIKPTILELRGNGALLHVCSLPNSELEFLHDAAKKYGEELCTAWFDPAFRWRAEVRGKLNSITSISEYRGLLMDERSFLEVRRFGKRRRKLFVAELLKTDLLFPLVKMNRFELPATETGRSIIVETTYGTGSMGRFEVIGFDLGRLELTLFKQKLPFQEQIVLFSQINGNKLDCLKDDFVVRSNAIHFSKSF